MFDPPGPPKRDILKSSTSRSHLLGYLPETAVDDQPSQHLEIEPVQSFAMYDHHTNELMDIDGVPLPTSGATVLTRYDNINESDVQTHNQQQAYANIAEDDDDDDNMNGNTEPYMNSFAESYNSLLNSSLNEDHSYVYNNEACEDSDFDDSNSYDNPNTTHQLLDRSHEPIYSLHKLQTRSEQQYDEYASTSSSPSSLPSTSHAMYERYQQNLVDHNYMGDQSQYPSTSSGYRGAAAIESNDSETKLLPLISSEYFVESNVSVVDPNHIKIIENYSSKESKGVNMASAAAAEKEYIATTSKEVFESDEFANESNIDNSIQINEISSSDSNESMSSVNHPSLRLRKTPTNLKKSNAILGQISSERKMTRSSLAPSVRVTRRSTGTEKQPSKITKNVRKVAVIIQKPSANGRLHKENISILRKVPVKALVDSAIVSPIHRTRHSEVPQQTEKVLNQRTLRSQNALTKDITSTKTVSQRPNQTANVNQIIQRDVAQAKVYAHSTRANNNAKIINNATIVAVNNAKTMTCKKQPKRLLNTESVQLVKSTSNKLQKSTELLAQAKNAQTLRFKVVVAKNSVVEIDKSVRPSITTRRMRLQQ